MKLGITPCPNDTFAFHGLLTGAVRASGLELELCFGDIEVHNRALARGELDAAKVSFHAALKLAREVAVLDAGAALGFGVGPLLLARPGAPRGPGGGLRGRVLVPGEGTTAALLLRLFRPGEGVVESHVFSEILPELASGRADYGVCIHEARFTWQRYGLELVEDLGERWESATGAPLPLGGVAARAALGASVLERVAAAIRASIDYGFAHREEALATMRAHAQELDDDVLWAHVALYVNAGTRRLGRAGERALGELAARARTCGALPDDAPPLAIVRAPLPRIFRIAARAEHGAALRGDRAAWSALAFQPDGFVHLSTAEQLAGALARHFAGAAELWLFELDRERVQSEIELEPARSGELFPHLYRPLEPADLERAWSLPRDSDDFRLPSLESDAAEDRPAGRRWPM